MKDEPLPTPAFWRRRIWLLPFGIILAIALWFFLPRPVKPLDFDPDVMARLETEMWRNYYDRNYPQLTIKLWETTRTQFGGSPFSALQIAYHASEAARIFQPSRNRKEAEAALPALQRYYEIIRKQSGGNFDPATVALLELDWWQLRREHAPREKIIEVIAELYGQLNGKPAAVMMDAARYRVEAMSYRDARRRTGLTTEEWNTVEQILRHSYHNLKEAVKPDSQKG